MFENLSLFFIELGKGLLENLKRILFFFLKALIIISIPIAGIIYLRSKAMYNKMIEKFGIEYTKGIRTAKALRLRNLYSTIPNELNEVMEGRIKSYVLIDNNNPAMQYNMDLDEINKLPKDYKENLISHFLVKSGIYKDNLLYEIP